MALQMQKTGQQAFLILLDSSIDYVKEVVKAYFYSNCPKLNDEIMETSLLATILAQRSTKSDKQKVIFCIIIFFKRFYLVVVVVVVGVANNFYQLRMSIFIY